MDQPPPTMPDIEKALANGWAVIADPSYHAEGGTPPTKDLWDRMATFLTQHVLHLWYRYGRGVPAPMFFPCQDGSIDLYWRFTAYRGLLNIAPDGTTSYYGEDPKEYEEPIRGSSTITIFHQTFFLWISARRIGK